jgi:hypothetical protein
VIPVTRPITGTGRHHHPAQLYYAGSIPVRRPMRGTPRVTVPLPQAVRGGQPFAGMDPSDPTTYVRPWNPADGMIGRLNFDGARMQDYTDMGQVWSNPASWNATAGGRPKRRPR